METFIGNTIKIILNSGIDLSGYPVRQIAYKKPDGTKDSWNATLETGNEKLSYTTTIDDLDIAGEWSFQIHVENAGGTVKLDSVPNNITVKTAILDS